jgi:cytochrome c2
LLLAVFPLAGTGEFAASEELTRGALAVAGGELFVMDKLGNIFRMRDKVLRKMDFGAFPSGVESYLLRTPDKLRKTSIRTLYIAHDPVRHLFLVSHQRYDPRTRHVRFTISVLPVDAATFERTGAWRTLFETEDIPDSLAFRGATGGKMVVAGDTLYFTVGDYNFGQVPQDELALMAQNAKSSFGKIYELDLRTGRSKVKSIGHRNPQGLTYTRGGLLIDAEHGPEGGDELNIVRDGSNYGWPYRTYGTDYGTFNWPLDSQPKPGNYASPLYSWVPSVAVSPVVEVTDFNEAWDGDLLVGSLKAQSLFRVKLVDERVVFAEPIWVGHRVRDIAILNQQIVLMTDDPALVYLEVDGARRKANSKLQKHVEFSPSLAACLKCHHFGPTNESHLAPSLTDVLGRKIANDSFARYSDGLRKTEGRWDAAALSKFLANPSTFAPGTTMPSLGLTADQVSEVVAALGRRNASASKASAPP